MGATDDARDDEGFVRLVGHSGEPLVVSREAFGLHVRAALNSAQDGEGGFVSDAYLDGLSRATTTPAVELCIAGLWQRVDGGYRIHDPELLDFAMKQFAQMAADRQFCRATGGHEPADGNPRVCRKCLTVRPQTADWPIN